jgi:hypothetical protein
MKVNLIKQKIFKALGIILCISVIFYLTRSFWHEQMHTYYLGKVEVTAQYYQRLPEDIEKVEVFILSDSQTSDDTNGFFGDFDQPLNTLAHKTLTGDDAKKVVELWGAFPIGRQLQSMCFNPVYGLQFKRNGKIYFQTSVCWECSGYTLPVSIFGKTHIIQYGFESKSKGAQNLLAILEKLLPLPPKQKIPSEKVPG